MVKLLFRRLFPRSKTDFPIAYIANRFFTTRAGKGPVLIIGDHLNREYESFRDKFPEVYSLDIVPNNGRVKEGYYIQQSIEDPLKFKDGHFGTIIMGEVIENLWRDRDALIELRRVLSDDGVFLLSLEFYADEPLHYHIYSPGSIELLLHYSGFEIEEMRYSGLIPKMIGTKVTGLMAVLLYPFLGKNALKKFTGFTGFLDGLLSQSKSLNGIFEMSAYVKARKAAIPSPLEPQVEYYEKVF